MTGLAGAEEVVDGCGRDRSVPDVVANGRLLFLLCRATQGDVAAARVAVARVVPALVMKTAAHCRSAGRGFDTVFDELLASAWIVVTTYPVERRPEKTWINIVLDTERAVFGRQRLVDRLTTLVPPPLLAEHLTIRRAASATDGPARDPLLELVDLLAAGRRLGLSDAALNVLVEFGIDGLSSHQVAARDGVTDRAVRLRRQRAVTELVTLLGLRDSTGSASPRAAGAGAKAHPHHRPGSRQARPDGRAA
ncbi:RNA polymerase subunit sigma-24 [Frankia sp. CcI49]|uniref:RNA polymerase subunit sigma-24 n=1 Tax=Frankia sp. CcI49 TaxID=1745382 RepID=UPI0009776916|nr:RNA polymerase subunit sigma-24 [Frankia sp. CcI49]ONH58981.1 RNA polymerase subunit sigma-24 [Frankia sp. CcI49]